MGTKVSKQRKLESTHCEKYDYQLKYHARRCFGTKASIKKKINYIVA